MRPVRNVSSKNAPQALPSAKAGALECGHNPLPCKNLRAFRMEDSMKLVADRRRFMACLAGLPMAPTLRSNSSWNEAARQDSPRITRQMLAHAAAVSGESFTDAELDACEEVLDACEELIPAVPRAGGKPAGRAGGKPVRGAGGKPAGRAGGKPAGPAGMGAGKRPGKRPES